MSLPEPLEGNRVILRFGAGINTVKSETDIDDNECADGHNFGLQIDDSIFFRRKPFDLVATAPNGLEVRGFVQLIKQDGTRSTLVQAGGTVYEWDGGTTFTSKGTVNSGARLRGRIDHNFTLDEYVIITDLNQAEPVMKWDGTTLSTLAHNLGGDFFARYCRVEDEAAWFANVKSGTATPHMLVRSKRSDGENLSVSDRPSSALGADDPFFLLAKDFLPINGIVSAFGELAFSTSRGRFYRITGTTSEDYALTEMYADSGAAGAEAIVFAGNDVLYGRQGKIESLFATETLGNVATDDRSRQIADLVEDIDDWLVLFNSRLQKVYFFDSGNSRVFVFHKAFIDERIRKVTQQQAVPEVSPWSIWKTDHSMAFQPTAAMNMRRPTDGLETIYLGGSAGEIFALEGSGDQDGGTTDIESVRLSKLYEAPKGGEAFNIDGWIRYRSAFAAVVTLRFEFAGSNLFNEEITIPLVANTNFPVFGGSFYFGGSVYFGAQFSGRLTRRPYDMPGFNEAFQVRITVSGAADFFVQELGIEFESSKG